MPLIKCPDCKKEISDRVKSCPFCGCPAEFFGTEETVVDNIQTENTQLVETVQVEEIEKHEENIEFVIGGYLFSYPKGSEKYAGLYGVFLSNAENAKNDLYQLYCKAEKIETALKKLPELAGEWLGETADNCAKLLYASGVNLTAERFINKYSEKYDMDYSVFYDEVVEEYSKILDRQQELKEYRNAVKASRGRWEGGGYGMSGAIKGAMNAAILNMGTDFMHSFGDSAQERSHNQIIQEQLRELYERPETKGLLCGGIYICIMNIYRALCKELKELEFFDAVISMHEKHAESMYESTIRYEKDPEKFLKNILECIYNNPGKKKYYNAIKENLIEELMNEESDFNEFIEFWNIEFLVEDIKEEAYKIIEEQNSQNSFEEYMIEQGMDVSWFEDYSAERAGKLINCLYEYDNDIPLNGVLNDTIKEYFTYYRQMEVTILSKTYVEIPCDINVKEFLYRVNEYGNYLACTPLNLFWPFNKNSVAPDKKIKDSLKRDGDSAQLYWSSSSFWDVGDLGIIVTEKCIINLKSKIKIPFSKVKSINIDKIIVEDEKKKTRTEKIQLSISDGNSAIVLSKDGMYISGCIHLKTILKIMFIRYGNNTYLDDGTMKVIKLETDERKYLKPYGYYDVKDTESEKKYDIYINKYIEKYGKIDDLYFSNEFRRRIKMIMNLDKDSKNHIYRYDYECDDERILEILGENEVKGQYILYYDREFILTDRNFYMSGEKIDLVKMQEIMFFYLNNNEYMINVVLKDGEERRLYTKREGKEEKNKLNDIIDTINVALDLFRGKDYQTRYDGTFRYFCNKCKSMNVKWRVIGGKCTDCGNTKFNSIYSFFSNDNMISKAFKALDNIDMDKNERRLLFYDENIQYKCLLKRRAQC